VVVLDDASIEHPGKQAEISNQALRSFLGGASIGKALTSHGRDLGKQFTQGEVGI
jgi:hypothetical protein